MSKLKLLIFLLFFSILLVSPAGLFAQIGEAAGGENTDETKKEEKKDRETLIKETMGLDIDTANYFELVAWCKTLGIDDSGGRQDLQNRLRTFFAIPETKGEAKKEERRIEIQSAKSSEYFSIEEVDENYILLKGNVVLVFTEEDNQAIHYIKAERILFNQSLNLISAEGNIEYTRKRGEEEEIFRGERFIFDVKKWGGVFYKAKGEKEKQVEDNTVLFFYKGDTISRLENDTVILENGTITSSKDTENPNYKITASKIWVFGPGEWAVQNAVLYVGRIPMMYVPFFFQAGDELFFHPVAGYRDREGYFLQTTTYFIGRKEKKPSVFSFLQFEESNKAKEIQYETKWRGLFLHEKQIFKKQSPEQAAAGGTLSGAVKTIKLFADVYSRLGGFIGGLLDISPVFKLKGGVGVSRTIYYGEGGYTPFYNGIDINDIGKDFWNSGYFFGIQLPFRYGLESQFEFSYGIIKKLSGNFEIYSDPFFPLDFYDRSEDVDWGTILGLQIKEKAGQPTLQSQDLSALERQNISWKLDSNVNFAGLFSFPYLTTLEMKTFSFLFEWSSKTDTGVSGDDKTAPAPNRMFYYPKRMIFPNATLSLGGTIFTVKEIEGTVASEKTAAPEEPGLGMISPLPTSAKEEEENPDKEAEMPLRVPQEQVDMLLSHKSELLSSSLVYSFNQNITMEYPFAYNLWSSIDEVDYETQYNSLKLDGDYWFTYDMGLWDKLLGFNMRIKLTERYKTLYNDSDSLTETEWDNLLMSGYQYSNFTTTKESTVTYRPFVKNKLFDQSNVTYKLFWDVYKYEFDELVNDSPRYESNFLTWNDKKVTQHEVSASLVYKPFDQANFLRMTYDMPPTLGNLESELNFYVWIFHTIVLSKYQQNKLDKNWYFQPLSITEEVILENYFMVKSVLRYDIENEAYQDLKTTASVLPYQYKTNTIYLFSQILDLNFKREELLERSQSTLKLWFFSVDYLAKYMTEVDALGLVIEPTRQRFLPSKLTFDLNYDTDTLYFWLNRVRLDTKINSQLNLDLQKNVASNLTFSFEFIFYVHEFLEISFKTTTINDNVYRYIPGFPEAVSKAIDDRYHTSVDIPWVNPLEDLWYSFAFWEPEARYRSFFKLKDLSFSITHHLGDWDLTFSFIGKYAQETQINGTTRYKWMPELNFKLKWVPIPEINSEIKYDEEEGLKL
jgi:lipopolysaccharide assembly outer membrane protein LptD (OstA)